MLLCSTLPCAEQVHSAPSSVAVASPTHTLLRILSLADGNHLVSTTSKFHAPECPFQALLLGNQASVNFLIPILQLIK